MIQRETSAAKPADPAEPLPDLGTPRPEAPPDPEWLLLCKRQPGLLELEKEAAAGTDPGYLTPRLNRLVGWYCSDARLKNRRSFDIAFAGLTQAYVRRRAAAAEALAGEGRS